MKYALLQDGLRYWRQQSPDKLALVLDDEGSLTYEQLGRWSDGIAQHLQRLGVRPGDNVGIVGANSLEWVAAAFGILKAGGVIVPYNDRFVRDELAYLVDITEPRVIIADAPRAAIIETLDTQARLLAMEQLEGSREGAVTGWQSVRVSPDSLALVVFTSGTTGRPKGVMFSHGQHVAKFYDFLLAQPSLGSDLRALMPFGLYSGPGSVWGYMISTIYGGTLYFTRKFDPAQTLTTLVRQEITYVMGMPLIFEQIGRLPAFETADLSAIQLAQVGGARVSKEMTRHWRAKGVVIRQLYGMTEVGGIAIIASSEEALAQPDACGRGMLFTQVRIVDANGVDCLPGVPGEVLIRGPGMMVGYWRNPKATAEIFTADGWIRSGDTGVLDEEGYFTFLDRAKDIIICGGFNISPSELEHVISQLEGILEVSVFPLPDEKFGETPGACIYASRPITPEEVFAHCREHLTGYKLPRYVISCAAPLPRMASNKIDRRKLAASYADAPSRFVRLG
jgi:fatty-acyl-CoA synthase